jgi:Gpi18-like mannosyltransferase
VLFYVALGLLLGLYLAAYRLAARAGPFRFRARTVGLWTLVFCLLLIPVLPLTSSDLYSYVFQGRIVAMLGQNPFAHVFDEFAADPFYFCVTFDHMPASAGYGPLWITIGAALGWLARDQLLLNLLLYKGLAAGLHLLSAGLVYATLKRLAPDHRQAPVAGMLFYAWNPVLLYELVGNGHNDAAVAFMALLAFYLLGRKRGLWAIPCLAVATLIKPVAALWLPLAALWLVARCRDWRRRARRAVVIIFLVLLPAVVALTPFWEGADTFQGVLNQSDIHGNSLPSVLILTLWTLWPEAQAGIIQGVKLFTILAFAPFYVWQLWRVWHSGNRSGALDALARACFDIMLFYLLFVGFQFWPWYLTWLMVPAALLYDPAFGLRRCLVLVLCALSPLLYFPFGWQWARHRLPVWAEALLAALPVIAAGIWLGIRFWQSRRCLL